MTTANPLYSLERARITRNVFKKSPKYSRKFMKKPEIKEKVGTQKMREKAPKITQTTTKLLIFTYLSRKKPEKCRINDKKPTTTSVIILNIIR